MLRAIILPVALAAASIAQAQDIPESIKAQRLYGTGDALTGKDAKFVVAGQVLQVRSFAGTPDSLCDFRKFNFAEALRLFDVTATHALRGDIGEEVALKHGMSMLPPKDESIPAWCDQLYIDAANWGMYVLDPVSRADLDNMKMLAAFENNDCNWDDTTKTEVIRYPEIKDATAKRVAANRALALTTMRDDIEALTKAQDEGYTYGTTNLAEHCPVIADFAKSLMD